MDLDFAFECGNCLDLFITPSAQAKYAMRRFNFLGKYKKLAIVAGVLQNT